MAHVPCGLGSRTRRWEGLFKWTDKTALNYKDWQAPQPDDYLNREDCAEIVMRLEENVLGWNDDFCTRINSYICKMHNAE